MKNKSLLMTIAFFIVAISTKAQVTGSFKDSRDGKIYKTVNIGTQTWMAENLAYKASSGCWAYANDQNNVATYGYLYDWATAKKVCPTGWHLPSKAEWDSLISFLGGSEVAGSKLKSNSYWKTKHDSLSSYAHIVDCAHKNTEMKHDSVLINSSNFNGLPGGAYYSVDIFDYKCVYASWWTSTEYNVYNSYYFFLYDISTGADAYYALNTCGFYLRCIKD